jgi:hypothetical protein
MREVEMASATTRTAFHGHGYRVVLPFEGLEACIATVLGIDIEHNDPRDST